jgi:hypothetical protein
MDGMHIEFVEETWTTIELVNRMPLAESAFWLWREVFDEARLQDLWGRYRGRCYEKVISFPTMVHLVADALLQYRGSGRRSFEKNIEQKQLSASAAAAFGKLARLPTGLSQGLLEEGTAALAELFPSYALRELPASLREFEVLILDGKAIKKVAKRLKPLRGLPGGMLGGKALVALQWTTGLAVAMQTHVDGEANENRLVGELMPRLRALVPGPRLFVADRGFCDLVQTARFTAETGDHFLVRYRRNTQFTVDPERKARKGKDARGYQYVETWGWLGTESNKGRRYVRRIHLRRPDEDEDLVLITDLLDADKYPASELLTLYHERWGIEQLFQKVTEVFGLARLIGGTPKACIFQFALCLMLHNTVQALTGYVAEAQKCAPEDLSPEKLFDDLHEQLIAWSVFFEPAQTILLFHDLPTKKEIMQRLRKALAHAWSDTWRKSPVQERHGSTHAHHGRCHGSVYRILKAHTEKTRPKVALTP